MKSRVCNSLLTVLMILVVASCASLQNPDPVQFGIATGATAKEAAEAAYGAVYISFLEGAVDQEDMEKADELYLQYGVALKAYASALKVYDVAKSSGALLTAEGAFLDLVEDLVALANQLGLQDRMQGIIEDNRKNEIEGG
jgi:hypothetical protein